MEKKNNNTAIIAMAVIFVVSLLAVFWSEIKPEGAFIKKLTKFSRIKNCYYDIEFKYKFMGLKEASQNIKQFKNGKKYKAKYFMAGLPTPTIVNIDNDEFKYTNSPLVAIKGTVEESKKEKSIFWLDKIAPSEIQKGTVKRVRASDNIIPSQKCKMYSAKLTTKGEIDLCINEDDYPVYMKYKGIDYSIDLISIVNLSSVTKGSGDIELRLSNFILNPKADSSFDISPKAKVMSVADLKKNMAQMGQTFTELNKALGDMKDAAKDVDMSKMPDYNAPGRAK